MRKTMKISGTYVQSVYTEVEVPIDATDEEQREALDNSIEDVDFNRPSPILHECSNMALID